MTAAGATAAATAHRPVAEGDLVEIEYDMWVEGVDGLFDTTHADRARESGIFDERTAYEPIVAVVGDGRLIAGLEEALVAAEPGKERRIEIPAEKGYGLRDPKLLETVPMRDFKRQKVEPHVGQRLQYKNRPATVRRVDGGRVQLDLNSPLAGRRITYQFTVLRILAADEEKVRALLKMVYPRKVEFGVTVAGDRLEVSVPRAVGADQQWILAKLHLVQHLARRTGAKTVRFVEEHDVAALIAEIARREAEAKATEAEAKAAAEAEAKAADAQAGADEAQKAAEAEAELVEEEMLTDEDRR